MEVLCDVLTVPVDRLRVGELEVLRIWREKTGEVCLSLGERSSGMVTGST